MWLCSGPQVHGLFSCITEDDEEEAFGLRAAVTFCLGMRDSSGDSNRTLRVLL